MDLVVGTSGFSYKAWKGPFYPEKLPEREMLAYYATKLSGVEVNNTFYRSPRREALERWAAVVPEGFRFAIKAPQAITHHARLRDVAERLRWLDEACAGLGAHRGPVLFQLPPTLRKDVPLLADFLAGLPERMEAALEFRHASWEDEEVLGTLRAGGAAWCLADVDGAEERAPLTTAPFGYLRLRREGYDEQALGRWAERVRATGWERAHVFFKHEEAGAAPRMALAFARLLARA